MTYKSLLFSFVFVLIFSDLLVAQEKPQVTIGGALRFNYHYDSWRDDLKSQGGELVYDMFRLNATAEYKKISVNAEYRFYSNAFGGSYLKQGWIGYEMGDFDQLQLGLTQVPFGIQQYNSNNWFFNIGYYVGLEDDHDIGIKYMHQTDEGWSYQVAFFKNAEYTGFGGTETVEYGRYSYDVTSYYDNDGDGVNDFRNKELNTLIGKVEYLFNDSNDGLHRIGGSGYVGQLYNFDTERNGTSSAFEGHYQYTGGAWDLKLEALSYHRDTASPEGEDDRVLAMAAYGSAYLVATRAQIYTASLKYTLGVDWGPVSSLAFYNDFGMMDKVEQGFETSYQNVTGVLVTAGMLYTYIDFAQGKNQSWIGGNYVNDFAQGDPNASWEYRFNINFGLYF